MQHTGPEFSENTATLFISIPNFVSIIAAPTFGYLIDKFGRSVFWIILSSAMLVVAHVVFLGKRVPTPNIALSYISFLLQVMPTIGSSSTRLL